MIKPAEAGRSAQCRSLINNALYEVKFGRAEVAKDMAFQIKDGCI